VKSGHESNLVASVVKLLVVETDLWVFAVAVGASALGGIRGTASGIFIVPVLTMFC
jgi:hypothetical protein